MNKELKGILIISISVAISLGSVCGYFDYQHRQYEKEQERLEIEYQRRQEEWEKEWEAKQKEKEEVKVKETKTVEENKEEQQKEYEEKKEEIMIVYRYYMNFKCTRRHDKDWDNDNEEVVVSICKAYLYSLDLPPELEEMRDELIGIMNDNYQTKIENGKQYKYFIVPKDGLEASKIYDENYNEEQYKEFNAIIDKKVEYYENLWGYEIYIPKGLY